MRLLQSVSEDTDQLSTAEARSRGGGSGFEPARALIRGVNRCPYRPRLSVRLASYYSAF